MPVKMYGLPPLSVFMGSTQLVENRPTQVSFLREPSEDIDFTGSVTDGCLRKGSQCLCTKKQKHLMNKENK